MKINTFLLAAMLGAASISAQQNPFYATMDATTAQHYQGLYPEMIEILHSKNEVSAVMLHEDLSEIIRNNVQTHGSNFIFMPSQSKALEIVESATNSRVAPDFSITETAFVNECLDLVNVQNIEENILLLQNYGTRHHTKPQATQAVLDQQTRWNQWIASSGRTDVHTRIYQHANTPMPSVILTFDGADTPDEFVIVGGHIDSTSWNRDDAPGADDNASGISSLNEMVRILLEKNFVPSSTVEVMAFAAEEIGLVGSGEIAAAYAAAGVNVKAYVQFDMTGYNGSSDDVYIMADPYTSTPLNQYLMQLMDHYNNSGDHGFTYGVSYCGYGCSDHASWAANGYHASMPFEAAMGEDNPFIHTPNDVYGVLGSGEHAAKFTKIALEFVIEAAKPSTLGTNTIKSEDPLTVYIDNRTLYYNTTASENFVAINVFNVVGHKMMSIVPSKESNNIEMQQLANGVYLVEFISPVNTKEIKRVLLH